VLGQWQEVVLIELAGPQERNVVVGFSSLDQQGYKSH